VGLEKVQLNSAGRSTAPTKKEEDVIGYSLTETACWADHIYVLGGASTDAT
jgi:hypothetical protein